MSPIFQYLRETRTELEHVSWPTQTQTIVYTIFVALLSVGIAVYLGFFDFLFTTALTRLVAVTTNTAPSSQVISTTTNPVQSASTTEPNFTITPATSTTK
ncbi:MAG: Protein translocase subunit SecE [Candidatus Kaiserbacteria bacterium]|nr:Protein translocase subunit SecE [Candidatus Kaiserbacteria bacterium]